MLIGFIDFLIFLITAGLLITVIARIPNPMNLVAGILAALVLWLIAHGLFAGSSFVWLYGLWMILVIAGLFALRWWLHQSRTH